MKYFNAEVNSSSPRPKFIILYLKKQNSLFEKTKFLDDTTIKIVQVVCCVCAIVIGSTRTYTSRLRWKY
jgi:hypothetical protein